MKKTSTTAKERALKLKYAFGGEDPSKPVVPKSGRPTAQDSLALYNNAMQVLDYYNRKGYAKEERTFGRTVGGPSVIEEIDSYAKKYDPSKLRTVPTKGGSTGKGKTEIALPKSQYRRDLNANQFFQREGADEILDTRAPMQLYDKRIQPNRKYIYENYNSDDPLFGDMVSIFTYDPETIKPAFLKGKGSVPPPITKRSTAVPKPIPPGPDLDPTEIQDIVPFKPNTQFNVKPQTINNKTKFSATYRDPGKDSKQQTVYFNDRNAWKSFLGTGVLNNVDTSETDDSASATGYKTGMFAAGGQAGGIGWGTAGQMLPVIGDALMSIFDKKGYTNQPIMNAQSAKNMTSPYAFGGELDDIDSEQLKYYLQAMFDNQAEAEDVDDTDYEVLNEGIDEDIEDTDDSFAMGGKAKKKIHIKPENRGKFNALKKRTGKTTEQLTHSKNPLTRKRAIFAQNAAKWKHAMGGSVGMTDIEVEGDEIIQTPDGNMQKMQGPSHENGGIDMTVPEGTKIYSDRLQVEGKTMQQRKLNRERRIASANKVFGANPSSAIARNTLERTKEVVGREEEQDMALQKIANKIYSVPRKAAYGDEVDDPWNDFIQSKMPGAGYQLPYDAYISSQLPSSGINVPYQIGDSGFGSNGKQLPESASSGAGNTLSPINTSNIPVVGQTGAGFTPTPQQMASAQEASQPEATYGNLGSFTTGDYIGMAGNLFNAIAPIINTKNARRATRPEINRFQGFGKQALEANAKAQGFAGVQAANAKRELDTATNSAILRNRLGARSINTARALDTVSDINRNKAANDIYAGYTNQISNLLGQEASLANQRDQIVMAGAQARDEREAQNIDNYYTNMADNLTNFGTNISNIGRNLNVSKANKDNIALLEAMSEYFDFGRDKSGKLVIKNKKKNG